LVAYKQGVLPKAYTAATTARYKRDLAKRYGGWWYEWKTWL